MEANVLSEPSALTEVKVPELRVRPQVRLKVMEVYPSWQGEGSRVGAPSTFVRLFGCNLRCTWCDTAYSINLKEAKAALTPAEFENLYEELTPEEIVQRCERVGNRDVVITGGEPTVQMFGLGETLRLLRQEGFYATIESNGVMPPIPEIYSFGGLWSISPKLPGSQATGILEAARKVRLVDWYLLSRARPDVQLQVKFVITKVVADLEAVMSLLLEVGGNLNENVPIYLVPNGDYIEDIWKVQDAIFQNTNTADWLGYNLRILPQIHILAFGRRRYV